MLKDKNIIILGGTGTLGTALVEQLIETDVRTIRVFARDEYRFFLLKQKYGDHPKIRYLLGDIRDRHRLNMAFKDVHGIINCAANKHISFCDEYPMEALTTNVLGVQYALETAVENNVEFFIQISTDKAVNPCNIYGQTKSLAEKLVLDAQNWCGKCKCRFVIIRSGNILGSSGSVLEIWQREKEQGLPLTVTDLNCTRYGASKEQIAKAVIDVAKSDLQGLVVLDMKLYSIKELLATMGDCEVNITGLKQGEKLSEILYREGEVFTKWKI